MTPHVTMIFFRDDLYICQTVPVIHSVIRVLFYLVFRQTGVAHMYNKRIIFRDTYIEMHISVRISGFTDRFGCVIQHISDDRTQVIVLDRNLSWLQCNLLGKGKLLLFCEHLEATDEGIQYKVAAVDTDIIRFYVVDRRVKICI